MPILSPDHQKRHARRSWIGVLLGSMLLPLLLGAGCVAWLGCCGQLSLGPYRMVAGEIGPGGGILGYPQGFDVSTYRARRGNGFAVVTSCTLRRGNRGYQLLGWRQPE